MTLMKWVCPGPPLAIFQGARPCTQTPPQKVWTVEGCAFLKKNLFLGKTVSVLKAGPLFSSSFCPCSFHLVPFETVQIKSPETKPTAVS